MGTGDTFDEAFAKAHVAAGDRLPTVTQWIPARWIKNALVLAQTLVDMI